MFLDHDIKLANANRSKYAPKRNRCHPGDPAYERTVTQIRLTKVIERLQGFALGENDSKGRPIIMTAGQVRSARLLLDKYIPNAKPIKLSNY
ncbi:MAG: hypothetical protein P8J14_04325 [Emcibacteraceae bacterium]|nr:hypothetical protein [Emcibacteraceae bacterium]